MSALLPRRRAALLVLLLAVVGCGARISLGDEAIAGAVESDAEVSDDASAEGPQLGFDPDAVADTVLDEGASFDDAGLLDANDAAIGLPLDAGAD